MITVRFVQREQYDINRDAEVITFMATTGKGTYFTEFVNDGAASLRQTRDKFKKMAVEAIQSGVDPCRLEIE